MKKASLINVADYPRAKNGEGYSVYWEISTRRKGPYLEVNGKDVPIGGDEPVWAWHASIIDYATSDTVEAGDGVALTKDLAREGAQQWVKDRIENYRVGGER